MSARTTAPAGGRRFWITVLCFALANAAAWVTYIQWQRLHRQSHLEITGFSPGDGAIVSDRQTLTWIFNLDVAPPKDRAPGQLTPAVAGKWDWYNPRTLHFTPDQPLPRATPFTVALNDDAVHTADGFHLAKPFTAALHTEGLALREVRQVAYDDGDRVILELWFNDKVLPTDVARALTLCGTSGKPLAFHTVGQASAKIVRIETDPLPLAELSPHDGHLALNLQLAAGLKGEAGPLGLDRVYDQSVDVASYLQATGARAYFPAAEEPFVQINFNNQVDVEAIKQVLSVTPAVTFKVVGGNEGIDLHGDFQAGTRYLLKITQPPAWANKHKMPKPTTLSVLVPDRSPGVWFENFVGYLSAQGNRAIMAHAVNLANLRVTVTRVYDNNLVG